MMPAQIPCPISDIDQSLSHYVHSRNETLRIRRALSKYLTAGLRPVNTATQNQHLNHECPDINNVIATNPPDLHNFRKNYLNAIRVRIAAQKRLGDLRASLEQLQHHHILESPAESDSQYNNEVTHSYVALLQQRRCFAELQVVQDSLEKLLNASPLNGSEDPKDLVKVSIGEQPDLPAERLVQQSQPQDEGPLILKLKKEVLEARSSMEHAGSIRAEAQNASRRTPTLEMQVYALSRARQEIIDWIQGELAKMEEESGFIEDASPVKRPVVGASTLHLASPESQIRDCYDRYTASRSATIESYMSIQTPTTNAKQARKSEDLSGPDIQSHNHSNRIRNITGMLPHLPHLSQSDASERYLLQQAVYLQTQISSADVEMADSLLRLSGESHLLSSRTKSIGHWGTTAAEVEALNERFTRERVLGSRQEVNSVSTIVDLCSLQSKVLLSG